MQGAEPMNVINHSSSALFVRYVRSYFSEAVPIKALAVDWRFFMCWSSSCISLPVLSSEYKHISQA